VQYFGSPCWTRFRELGGTGTPSVRVAITSQRDSRFSAEVLNERTQSGQPRFDNQVDGPDSTSSEPASLTRRAGSVVPDRKRQEHTS